MKKAALLFLSLLPIPLNFAFAQGKPEDYRRANTLRERTQGKVFRADVRPNWIGQGNRFWYRNELPGGRSEFILVQPEKAEKRPAFDHARLATALSRALNRPVEATKLPVATIRFTEKPNELLVQVRERNFVCDLTSYALRPAREELGRAQPLAPGRLFRRAERNGAEASLTFLNQTKEPVTLYWVSDERERRAYGTLRPGETREQHTFGGHAWLVAKQDGTPLVGFIAQDTPTVALIEGAIPERTPAPRSDPNASPDGKWSVTLRNDNVFLQDRATQSETQLTRDGSVNDAYDGTPVWSPDSRKFVLFQTIPAQPHPIYLTDSSPRDQLQPKLLKIDYLKPGDRIAHPRPALFDVEQRRRIPISDALFPNPWEITELRWEPDSRRFTFLYNQRGHQVVRVLSVDTETGAVQTLIDEQAKTFIDWTNKVYFHPLPKTREALWMSERSGWNHLYLYDTAQGKVKRHLTFGNWVVRGVERVDEEKGQVWFRASGVYPNQDPYYIHYGRVNLDGNGLEILTQGDGTHKISFSPDGAYFVDTYSRVDLPPVTEVRESAKGTLVMTLERGDASALLAMGLRYPERFVAKGRDGATDIYGLIFRPSNFDPKRKYPVIENIYAGPHGSHVPKAFSSAHGSQSVAELGFIVVQIDGMGTNDRGKAFHDVCWKNLGDAGFPDRIAWIRAAAKKYSALDLTRVGVYGTSAGGQNALGGLLQYPDFYKAAVADCGCHDNRMDKIWWTEQWMGYPIGAHYEAQSNVTLAPRLKGKLLLLVGELDTNVDPASTLQVVNALLKADKDFDFLLVPGAGHGVLGIPAVRRRMQDFFVRHLLGAKPPSVSD